MYMRFGHRQWPAPLRLDLTHNAELIARRRRVLRCPQSSEASRRENVGRESARERAAPATHIGNALVAATTERRSAAVAADATIPRKDETDGRAQPWTRVGSRPN